jgi:hypothetical protein
VATASLRLPEDAVLLHIGLFKTGTTAIQGALFQARSQLGEHRVLHAGRGRHPMEAVLAFRGSKSLIGNATPRIGQWHRLVDQVAAAPDKRVVVSSEFFSDADVETARRAVQALGGSRVHVVVTLRPLTKLLASQWQQYVRNQATFPYDDWLDGMLRKPPYNRPTPSFWKRNHHDVLVERWASIVGPENVTVIVVDETDRGSLLRTFEELLGLPSDLLVAERDTENRSMTLGEIELIRQINIEFRRRGWSDELYKTLMRRGLVLQMQTKRTPRADEPRITTPQWALDRVAEIGATDAEKLSTLDVRIVGDISTLGASVRAEKAQEATRANIVLPVDGAREAVIGMITASLVEQSMLPASMSSRELARIILFRLERRLRRRSRRLRRRSRRRRGRP